MSLLGDQFFLVALPWLVLQLTGNAFSVGAVVAVNAAPRAVFILLGGVLIDRWSPRTVMLYSNLARMVLVAVLAVLTATGFVRLWMLYPFAFLLGLGYALFLPALSAVIPRLGAGRPVAGGQRHHPGDVAAVAVHRAGAGRDHDHLPGGERGRGGRGARGVGARASCSGWTRWDSLSRPSRSSLLVLPPWSQRGRPGRRSQRGVPVAGGGPRARLAGQGSAPLLRAHRGGEPGACWGRWRWAFRCWRIPGSPAGRLPTAGSCRGWGWGRWWVWRPVGCCAVLRVARSPAGLLASCAALGVGLALVGVLPSAGLAALATFLIGVAEGYLIVVFITWLQLRTSRANSGG